MSNNGLHMPQEKKGGSRKTELVLVGLALAAAAVAGWIVLGGDDGAVVVESFRGSTLRETAPPAPSSGGLSSSDPLPVTNVAPPAPSNPVRNSTRNSGPAATTPSVMPGRGDALIEPPQPPAIESGEAPAKPVESPPSSVPLVNSGTPPEEAVDNAPTTLPAGTSPSDSATAQVTPGDAPSPETRSSASDQETPGEARGAKPEDAPASATPLEVSSRDLTPEERAALNSVSGVVSDNAPPAEASLREDSTVTWAFVKNIARWLVDSYQPGNKNTGAGGQTTATLLKGNIKFGASHTGLRYAGNDPIRGRTQVLEYAYSPGMLDALHRLYGTLFVDALHQAALEKGPQGRSALTIQQEADMYAVYARSFGLLASSLRGVATTPDLRPQVEAILRTDDAVASSTTAFTETLMAFEQARDSGDTARMEALSQELVERSKTSETAQNARISARTALTERIRQSAGGATLGNDSLIYLAQWVYRRGDKPAATSMAAEVCTRVARQLDAEARRLRSQ